MELVCCFVDSVSTCNQWKFTISLFAFIHFHLKSSVIFRKCKIRVLISTLFVLLAICSRFCLKKWPVMENDLRMAFWPMFSKIDRHGTLFCIHSWNSNESLKNTYLLLLLFINIRLVQSWRIHPAFSLFSAIPSFHVHPMCLK